MSELMNFYKSFISNETEDDFYYDNFSEAICASCLYIPAKHQHEADVIKRECDKLGYTIYEVFHHHEYNVEQKDYNYFYGYVALKDQCAISLINKEFLHNKDFYFEFWDYWISRHENAEYFYQCELPATLD